MKFKKAISLCLAFLLSSGATMFTACGGGDNSSSSSGGIIFEDEDNVTQLNIKIFNGGLGYAWLETIADDFMRTFKDVSFEPNKKGVKVNITPNKQFTDLHLNMASGADLTDEDLAEIFGKKHTAGADSDTDDDPDGDDK